MKTKYVYDFPRPSVTATIGLFVRSTWNSNAERIILGKRGRKDGAYAGYLCLPGGFLDAKVDDNDLFLEEDYDPEMSFHLGKLTRAEYALAPAVKVEKIAGLVKPGETVEDAAIREIFEETGLKIEKNRLEISHVHSDPNTDPRAHVVNVCYFVMLTPEEAETAVAGDDLDELIIEDLGHVYNHTLAFNHNDLFDRMRDAIDSKYPDSEDDL